MKKLDLEDLIKETELYDRPETEKQRHILEAAEKLFGKRGYDETPTAEIAREAGVTEKTLFKHFPSKDLLLRRVLFPILLRVVLPTQIRHVQELFRKAGGDVGDLFMTIARDRLAHVVQHRGKMRFLLQELVKNDGLRGHFGEIWRREIYLEALKLIRRLQGEGQIRRDLDPESVTRIMVSLAASYLLTRTFLRPEGKWDDEHELAQTLDILMNGVRPEAAVSK